MHPDPQPPGEVVTPRWYTVEQVAVMLNYGLTKTKYLVHSGQIRSVKQVVIQLHHMAEVGSHCGKRCLDILENLLCLCAKIVAPDQIS